MSEAQIIEFLKLNSDFFSTNDIILTAVRTVGWLLVKGLSLLLDCCITLYDWTFGLIDITRWSVLENYLSDYKPLIQAIMMASLVILGFMYMFGKNKKHNVIHSVLILMVVMSASTTIFTELNRFSIAFKDAALSGGSTVNGIAVMKSRNLYRFNYMTSADLENGLGEIGTGMFTHPCPGMTYQSSYFGEIREFETGGHKGNDYAAPAGTPTLAAADGTVTVAGWSDSAGNWVVIDHGNGLTTKYMHHSRLLVKTGDTVKKGQQIGEVGSTGQSTGNHLHFQVEENGVPVNPDKYLKGEGNERE